MAANNKTVKRGVELYIDGKQIKNDIASVEREARALTKEMRSLTIGTEEYNKKAAKLRELNSILAEHRNSIRGVREEHRSMMTTASDWFNQYMGFIAAATAAIGGLGMAIMEYRKKLLEREDTKADVKALTGLDDESVNWLEEQAKVLSTSMIESGIRIRESATEILNAYKLVGSAKPELLQNKEALNEVTKQAMILSQAAGMDLKHAVDAVTLSMNQYGAAANDAGRYANVMAAGSKYGAAAVESVTTAVQKAGVAASTAGVPIEQLVGSIEALAEKGIKNEIAGTGLKSFFLKLEKQAADVRPSVVGLQKALENLAAKNLSAEEMIKMFGLTTYTVAQAMIGSADKVQYYSDVVTNTTTAIEQASIKSSTAAAKLAQLKNKFAENGMVLAEELAPAMSKFMHWTNKIVQALPGLVKFLKEYGGEMTILATTIAVLTLRVKAATLANTAWGIVTSSVTKMISGYRMAMVLLSDAIAGCSMATTRLTKVMAAQNIVCKAAVTFVALMKAAYYALTLQLSAASGALQVFKVALASTGWGAAIVATGALLAGMYSLTKAHNKEVEAMRAAAVEEKKRMKQYDESKAKINALRSILENETMAIQEREKALHKLKEIVPDYHASLSAEGKLIENNTKALDDYLDNLKKTILYEYNYEKLKKMYRSRAEVDDTIPELEVEYERIKEARAANLRNNRMQSFGDAGRAMADARAEAKAKEALDKAKENVAELDKQIEELEAKIGKLKEEEENSSTAVIEPEEPAVKTEEEKESEKKKRIREALLAVDAEYDRKAAELKQRYIDGEIQSEQEYSDQLQAIELARLNAKMKVAGLEESQRADIMDKMMNIEIRLRQKIDKMVEVNKAASIKDQLKALSKSYEDQKKFLSDAYELGIIPSQEKYDNYLLKLRENYELSVEKLLQKEADEIIQFINAEMRAELNALDLLYAQGELKEKEYQRRILAIRKEYNRKKLQVQDQSEQKMQEHRQENAEIEIQQTKNANEATVELFKKRTDAIEEAANELLDVMEEIGEAIADAAFGDTDSLKEAGKDFLKTCLSVVEKYIMIKQAQMLADAVAEASTIAGAIKAGAKVALRMAAIKTAFGIAKGAISNFWDGGYTGTGKWNQPKGVVHSNEFVANRFATANPEVNSVLRLIDAAQRTGSVSNLSGNDIAAVASNNSRHSSTSSISSVSPQRNLPVEELVAMMARVEKTMQDAKEAYLQPSKAYCFVDGKGGINEAQSLADKMKRNAKRNG